MQNDRERDRRNKQTQKFTFVLELNIFFFHSSVSCCCSDCGCWQERVYECSKHKASLRLINIYLAEHIIRQMNDIINIHIFRAREKEKEKWKKNILLCESHSVSFDVHSTSYNEMQCPSIIIKDLFTVDVASFKINVMKGSFLMHCAMRIII